jgi:hypothetical protein
VNVTTYSPRRLKILEVGFATTRNVIPALANVEGVALV